MRILVTGASGFAGRPLVDALAREGHGVRAAVRDRCTAPANAGEVVLMPDMRAPFAAAALVSGCEGVVHVAGLAHSSPAIPEAEYMAVNCEAARSLAEASREAGVRRFVYISSVRAQSGPSAPRVLSEADAPEPTDAYGRSKLAGERAVADALAGSATQYVILRPVLMYGQNPKGNMATLLRLAHLPFPLPLGGFSARRSLLGMGNFCSAVSHALAAPRCSGGTYLLADGPPLTAGEIVASFRRALGRPAHIVTVPVSGAASVLRLAGKADLAGRLFGDLVADTAAFRATGWRPPFTTAEGLAQAAAPASRGGHEGRQAAER